MEGTNNPNRADNKYGPTPRPFAKAKAKRLLVTVKNICAFALKSQYCRMGCYMLNS